jgi:hypothetical protein
MHRPPGYPAAPGRPPSATSPLTAVWALALLGLACVIAGISVKESGNNAWHTVHAWGALAIAGAVLTAAPAWGPIAGLGIQRAQQLAVIGAGALVLYWVLFVLPTVGSNTSLLTTVGVGCGAIAAWVASGRPSAPPRPDQNGW